MNLLNTGALAMVLSALSLACITPVFAADDYDDYESEYVDPDPWESFNRVTFRFNDTVDRYTLRPVSRGYKAVTPKFMRDGVGNFFNNLEEPMNFLNNGLQGKFNEAGVDMSRFLFNTLLGGFGLVDVATRMGLERNDEDLGQTLGYWGVPSGPYVMLPFLGPNTVRDTGSKFPENFFNYTYTGYMNDVRARNQLFALEMVDARSGLLDQERLITGDRYTFIRNAYLQNREYKVRDGNVPDEF